MSYYCTFGELQEHLKSHYLRTGSRMQFFEMWNSLSRRGLLITDPPEILRNRELVGKMPDHEFESLVNRLYISFNTSTGKMTDLVQEDDIIPIGRDAFCFRHPRYTRPMLHVHNHVEVNFVSRGSCLLHFEDKTRTMKEGELCIIAPGSRHDIEIVDDETFVFTLMLRTSTFDTVFFSLLAGSDLLADFFRTILHSPLQANYLLFYLDDMQWVRIIFRNVLMESCKSDNYANNCCSSWINLLFATVLRSYSKSLQFYDYTMGTDFSLVLQYIQHNYQTVTLSSLAAFFHYSEPHLCTLIKRNTGHSFTDLVKRLRMNRAVSLLQNTDMKIAEIAENIGYHSADHFSRVFRGTYHMSPAEYRKLHGRQPVQPGETES